MPSYQKYIPGAFQHLARGHSSIASDANSTSMVMRAAHKGTLLAAYYIPEASINSEASDAGSTYRIYKLVNGGSDGTGTTILGSYCASASKEAFVPFSLTTQSGCSWSAGDVLEFQTASGSLNNKDVAAGCFQIDWRFER